MYVNCQLEHTQMFYSLPPSLPSSIVATPGQFLHVLVEMELKLHSLQYM